MTNIADEIDGHEKPRYTTRRLRYEIELAVDVERRRCSSIARVIATDVRNSAVQRITAGKIYSAILDHPGQSPSLHTAEQEVG